MILLKGHSLEHGQRVPVVSMSLKLKERDTTASLVPESMSGITTESWLLDDTNPGKGIVYRVRSIQTAYATDTPTIQLEHVIQTLTDRILFGETTPEMMGGGDTCTARQAVEYILRRSDDWTLGKFDYADVYNAYKFDGDSLLDALEDVSRTLEDCRWSYDLSVYPFKLNIQRKQSGVMCEMRPGRNLVAITKTIDRTGMYTRFYPIGKDDLHLPGSGYAQKNTTQYGVVEKTEVDVSRETVDQLQAWANQRLKTHAEPRVEISAEGLELADATGESLDRLTLGRECRIPLEEFNTIIEEEIVELNYRDKKNEPENVRVTMANEQEDIVKILANEIKEGSGPNGSGRGGGGGRGGARQQKEDHAWFEDTDEHVAMCAVGIIGVDSNGKPNWERLSRLEVNEDGIYGEVQEVQNGVEVAKSRLDINERMIQAEVTRATAEEGRMNSRITVEADRITSEVSRAKTNEANLSSRITQTASSITAEVNRATAAEGNLSSRITINAEGIATKVEKNGVISAINQSAESVDISASRINLSGYVTASQLETTNAMISNLESGVTTASILRATSFNGTNGTFTNCSISGDLNLFGHNAYFRSITINGSTYNLLSY